MRIPSLVQINNWIWAWPVMLMLLAMTSCQVPVQGPKLSRHVVVIGIDGLTPEGIRIARTPNMDRLIREGAYHPRARAILMSSSRPNWAAMLTGVAPEQSGITSNSWDRDSYILPPVALGPEQIFPSLFGVIRDRKPAFETGSIYQWDGLERMFEASVIDFDTTIGSDRGVANEAKRYIQEKQPGFLFVQLGHVDGIGHSKGFGSKAYLSMIQSADTLVGMILDAIKTTSMNRKTLVVLTADHGGWARNHGGETVKEMEVPFILNGPGVKKNYRIKSSVSPIDLPATVLFSLGIDPPPIWRGRPVKEAFKGFDAQTWVYKNLAAVPVYYPEGGAFLDSIPEIHIETATRGGEIRYTLDGTEPTSSSPRYEKPLRLTAGTDVKAKTFLGEKSGGTQTQRYFLLKQRAGHGLLASIWPIRRARTFGAPEPGPSYSDTVYEVSVRQMGMAGGVEKIEFDGELEIPESGNYTFFLLSDCPSRIAVGEESFRFNRGHHSGKEIQFRKKLDQGRHRLRVTYFPGGTGRALALYWQGPGIEKEPVPADRLFLPVDDLGENNK